MGRSRWYHPPAYKNVFWDFLQTLMGWLLLCVGRGGGDGHWRMFCPLIVRPAAQNFSGSETKTLKASALPKGRSLSIVAHEIVNPCVRACVMCITLSAESPMLMCRQAAWTGPMRGYNVRRVCRSHGHV